MPTWQAGPTGEEGRKVVRVLTKSEVGAFFVRVLTNGSKTATALNAEIAENAENGLNPGNDKRQRPAAEPRQQGSGTQRTASISVKANGNGGSLKGSHSIAWGNAPGRQVRRPNPQIKPCPYGPLALERG